MSDFLEKLNGKAISDNNSLHGRKRITVYVENESDVPFWKFAFAQQNVSTQVTASTHYNEMGNLQRGKQNVLRFAGKTNKDFILCIDSDFDCLLQNTNENSRKINENEFIFQTYVYSVENYQCFAPVLNQIMVEATLSDDNTTDFERFLNEYSSIIYDLFVKFLYFEVKFRKNTNITHSFPQKEFEKLVSLTQTQNLVFLKDKLKVYFENNCKIDKIDVENMQNELKKLGLEQNTAYLFLNGHALLENVVLPLLRPAVMRLRKQKEAEIRASEHATDKQISDKMREYKNKKIGIETLLTTHKSYTSCVFYKKIQEKTSVFIKKYHF